MKIPWRTAAAVIILCLMTLLPRATAFDQVVTPDERKWLARAANFNYAIAHGDLEQTFQREHPGVTIMWAGALGILQRFPTYADEAPKSFGWAVEEIEPWLRANSEHSPLDLLIAGRRWIALFVTLTVIGSFFAMRRLFGEGLAFLAALYVAADPFFIANSFELHPDGLLSGLFMLAALSFLAWLYGEGKWRYLALSAITTGLAWLTKTPAIFLIPTVGIITLIEVVTHRQPWRRMLLALIGWGTLATLTFFALWPAMWVSPMGTLGKMYAELVLYAGGHINPNFFRGEITQEPGILYYPLAYLLRVTPATLIGLTLTAPMLVIKKWPFSEAITRRTVYALLIFAAIFALGISIGAKKFDRYLLPTFICLDIIAVLGWAGIAEIVVNYFKKNRQPATHLGPAHQKALAGVLIIWLTGHALFSLLHTPYFLTYYNPLVGGSRGAENTLMVGWGEGLDQAADWLNDQPDAAEARIVAWYGDGPLSYFLDSDLPTMNFWLPDFWADADYAVLYVNQRQREIPSYQALRVIEKGELLHTVRAEGIDLARIYRMPSEPPAFTDMYTESATSFGDTLRLAAYALGERTVLTGDALLIRYHLEKIGDTKVDLVQVTRLVNGDGQEVWRGDTAIDGVASWPRNHYRHIVQEIQLPGDIPAGEYGVTVAYQPVGNPAQLLPPASDPTHSGAHQVTTLNVLDSVRVALDADWDRVRLRELAHSATAAPGQPLLVVISADDESGGARKLSLRLVDGEGNVVAQLDRPAMPMMEFELALPDDLARGEYALHAVLYDPETLYPLPDQIGEFSTVLSTIFIGAAE